MTDKPKRRWYQFSLRTLFIITTLFAIPCSWYAYEMNEAAKRRAAIAEIEKNLGTQFDREVGQIFLDSDIKKLWTIIQDGFIERWDYSNFSEYGAIAVGTLLR